MAGKKMTLRQRFNAIKAGCEGLGVYREEFDPAIWALAKVEEERDSAWAEFEAEGSVRIITTVNKAGAEYRQQNPSYTVWLNLVAESRSQRRELGLTPAGLKKLREDAMKVPKKSALAEALAKLDG
ncbi:MAG: P27 family phage terminase small subunit [Oscillospiraceae bacterium]|nr:P27 family phage terminase small subunit [Oscillospiraceae bacterium]